jgi:hypothetical protein
MDALDFWLNLRGGFIALQPFAREFQRSRLRQWRGRAALSPRCVLENLGLGFEVTGLAISPGLKHNDGVLGRSRMILGCAVENCPGTFSGERKQLFTREENEEVLIPAADGVSQNAVVLL